MTLPPDNNGLHLVPRETPAVPAYARNSRNRHRGRQLWFRIRVERKPMAQAWMEVFPESSANSKKSASNMCSRFMKWYDATYPETFEEAASEFDLGPHRMMAAVNDMLEAVVWRWDAKKGEYVPTKQPDHKARAAGVDRLKAMIEMSDRFQKRTIGEETPTDLQLPPKFNTPQEFETWAEAQDVKQKAESELEQAAEEMQRLRMQRLAERQTTTTEQQERGEII